MTYYKEQNLTEGRDYLVQESSSLSNIAGINERMSRLVTGISDVKAKLQKYRIEIESLRNKN
jgi:hypothetical protein